MDTQPSGEDADDRDTWLSQLIRQIEERSRRSAVLLCTACTGTGMCNECGGNGRTYVPGLGMFACTVCSGDGARTTCAGTGRRSAA